jgi:uncharacterized protein with ParB-like and HNH nuclease domain
MKGEDKRLYRFLGIPDTRYIIPLYQRNYDWKNKHCKQLFTDLIKMHEEKRESHFFGSVVTSRASDVQDDYLIIDGQQRATTITLLLLAMINAAKAGDLTSTNPDTVAQIYNTYIVNPYQHGERNIKLRHINNDRKAFEALLSGTPDKYIPDSNMTKNYLYFYEVVKACGLTIEQLFASIRKLVIIDIRLQREDDAQLIFESLNSTGLDLSEADKIRNYLLMSMNSQDQERCYESYWNKIEEYTDYNPTMFIRDYMTIHTKTIPNIDNLYTDFKDFVKHKGFTREDVLNDMSVYARYYYVFYHFKSPSTQLNKKFRQLCTIESTIGMAYYMAFLKYADEKDFTDNQIYEVFDIIEGYWARRIMCNYPTNAMNKAFASLHHEVLKYRAEEVKHSLPGSPYAEVLKFALLKRQGTGEFPVDSVVEEEFKTRQIYRIPPAYRCFLFERMENYDNAEGDWENIVNHIKNGEYTIEHIMPQTLTASWRQALGDEFDRIHQQYLHTFANLTLTGYNSSYANRSFTEKKYGYEYKGKHVYGFIDSKFSLSNYLKTIDQWTEAEILERQKLLYARFLKLWPMISTTFKPVEKDTDLVSFDDDELEVTGRSIFAFSYKGVRYLTSTWTDMLVDICKLIYSEVPSSIRLLCNGNYWLHDNDSAECKKFADDCYVYASCSTKTKMSILHFLFEKLDIPQSELEFELVPQKEDSNDEILNLI